MRNWAPFQNAGRRLPVLISAAILVLGISMGLEIFRFFFAGEPAEQLPAPRQWPWPAGAGGSDLETARGSARIRFEDLMALLSAQGSRTQAQLFAEAFQKDPSLRRLWQEFLKTHDTERLLDALRRSDAFATLFRRFSQDPEFRSLVEELANRPELAGRLQELMSSRPRSGLSMVHASLDLSQDRNAETTMLARGYGLPDVPNPGKPVEVKIPPGGLRHQGPVGVVPSEPERTAPPRSAPPKTRPGGAPGAQPAAPIGGGMPPGGSAPPGEGAPPASQPPGPTDPWMAYFQATNEARQTYTQNMTQAGNDLTNAPVGGSPPPAQSNPLATYFQAAVNAGATYFRSVSQAGVNLFYALTGASSGGKSKGK